MCRRFTWFQVCCLVHVHLNYRSTKINVHRLLGDYASTEYYADVQRKLIPLVFGVLFVRNAHKKDAYT